MTTSHDPEDGAKPVPAQKRKGSALLKQLKTLNEQKPLVLNEVDSTATGRESETAKETVLDRSTEIDDRAQVDASVAAIGEAHPASRVVDSREPTPAIRTSELDVESGARESRVATPAAPSPDESLDIVSGSPEHGAGSDTRLAREKTMASDRPHKSRVRSDDDAFPDHRYRPKARRRKPVRSTTATREAATTYVVPKLYEDFDELVRRFKFDEAYGARPIPNSRLIVTAIEELLTKIAVSKPPEALLARLRRPRDYETKKLGFSLPVALRKRINRALEAVNENRPRGAYQILLSHVAEVALEELVPRLLFAQTLETELIARIRERGDER